MEFPVYSDDIKNIIKELKNTKEEIRKAKEHYENLKKVYEEVSKTLERKKKKSNLSRKICSSCHQDLSEEEIKYRQVYCDECCSNDSCLDRHFSDDESMN